MAHHEDWLMWCRLKLIIQNQSLVITVWLKEASLCPGIISEDPFVAGPAAELTFRLCIAIVSPWVSKVAGLNHDSDTQALL